MAGSEICRGHWTGGAELSFLSGWRKFWEVFGRHLQTNLSSTFLSLMHFLSWIKNLRQIGMMTSLDINANPGEREDDEEVEMSRMKTVRRSKNSSEYDDFGLIEVPRIV